MHNFLFLPTDMHDDSNLMKNYYSKFGIDATMSKF